MFLHPANGACRDLLIDSFHALLGQGAGVFNGLLSYAAPAGVSRRVIFVSCEAVKNASGPEPLFELRILWIVGQFRLFFGVQVIEIAKEFVEPVHGRQELIAIAEVVLAELAGRVAERLEHFGDGWVLRLQSDRGPGHSNLGRAGVERVLTANEGRPSSCTALLAVVVSESDAFFGDAVDVWGGVAHHASAEVTNVPSADVVAPENQDVRLLCHDLFLCRLNMVR